MVTRQGSHHWQTTVDTIEISQLRNKGCNITLELEFYWKYFEENLCTMNDNKADKAPAATLRHASDKAPNISIEALLAAHREVVILHGGERYRLRLASNNKLILTK